jgi:hypothetical protein
LLEQSISVCAEGTENFASRGASVSIRLSTSCYVNWTQRPVSRNAHSGQEFGFAERDA